LRSGYPNLLAAGNLAAACSGGSTWAYFSQHIYQYWASLGFAYRIGDKSVVRGGAGLVYDNWAAVSQMSQNIEGDWPGIGQLIASNLNVPGGSTTDANGQPLVNAQDPFAGGGTSGLPAPTPFFAAG
jgi:hypothetical protein